MGYSAKSRCARLMIGVAASALVMGASPVFAQEISRIDLAPQSLASALYEFGRQTGHQVIFSPELTKSKTTPGISGGADEQVVMAQLLAGTGLTFRREGNTFMIVEATGPQSGSAAGDGAEVDALIVTAQKKEENIQDVPIAISAFTQKDLEAQKIEGGFDLLKAIPNVTFSKNNFSSYNFSIRGVGTKAISVATDPGVAVEFNDTPLIRNRLFEQEYFDIERVEVLRGPQGTLHGRNATAGVINVISSKPDLDEFSGSLKGEVGNYHTKRVSAFVNVPLVEDALAVRIAGALTSRQGYDYNATTKNAINGRDLWSTRLTIGFRPTENIRADFIWERFNEDDNRSRTGKQLCHHDAGPEDVGAVLDLIPRTRGVLSQGCKPGSLYDTGAFGTPNGISIPFILAGSDEDSYIGFTTSTVFGDEQPVVAVRALDPYGGMRQSEDLRVINSIRDPIYRANTDLLELNVTFDLTPEISIVSQTAYVKDEIYSFQDYNRFNTVPIFSDTSSMYAFDGFDIIIDPNTGEQVRKPSRLRPLLAGGVYCDPQIGCSDSIAGFDISRAKSEQFSQEFRLQSSFDGPLNFSVGANYTRYTTLEDYFVLFNLITLLAQTPGPLGVFNDSADVTMCRLHHPAGTSLDAIVPVESPGSGCIYIDPNPLESINGDGHNYFRSKNPYRLKSAAAFGELYWQAREDTKVTLGLRYTEDRKVFTPIPSQVLLGPTALLGGTVTRGYPALPDIEQEWGELTGRLGVDWRPDLGFTDETLLYAFIARGYKGGGANPPGIGYRRGGHPDLPGAPQILVPLAYPETFEPEFVNALEIGSKNTLLDGALIFNIGAFYYDYKDYQVSQIKERTAVNENFDATVWGVEVESVMHLSPDLRLNATFGYQDSEVAEGETSIDLMDRTAGNTDWMVVKPWIQMASNCIAPKSVVEAHIAANRADPTFPDFTSEYSNLVGMCPGFALLDIQIPRPWLDDPAVNGGAGFAKELGGNELPNAPHWTVSFGAQYEWDLLDGDWRATVRGDAYWQSQSWARVYNFDPYDKLHGWYNLNLSFWIERPEDELKIEIYAKNLLDKTPITDAFLNSDDTALTTNVFVLDPRLIGLSIKKGF